MGGRAEAARGARGGSAVVVVATAPGCRHCARAKAALREAGVSFDEADLTSQGASGLRAAVAAAAGGDRAVPQAFGLGRHLGNADALVAALGAGELVEELRAAGPPAELPEGVGSVLAGLLAEESGAGGEAAEDAGVGLARALREDWRAVWEASKQQPLAGAAVLQLVGGGEDAEARAGALLRSGLLAGPGASGGFAEPAEYRAAAPAWAPSAPDAPLNTYLRWPFPPRPAGEVAEALRGRVERLYARYLAPGGGSVDYSGLAGSSEFREYCDAAAELQAVDLAGLESLPDRIAFWVNVYNALIVHGTALRGAPGTTPERLSFFSGLKYEIGGLVFSCDDVEHGVLRGNAPSPAAPGQLLGGLLRLEGGHPLFRIPFLNAPHFKRPDDPRRALAVRPEEVDPRIHFALNCGARSCPPIRVYSAASLEEGLAAAASAFCEGEVEVDEATGAVSLSKIFQWYGRDFAPDERGCLLAIAKFLPAARAEALRRTVRREGGARVRFRAYDWTSNGAP